MDDIKSLLEEIQWLEDVVLLLSNNLRQGLQWDGTRLKVRRVYSTITDYIKEEHDGKI